MHILWRRAINVVLVCVKHEYVHLYPNRPPIKNRYSSLISNEYWFRAFLPPFFYRLFYKSTLVFTILPQSFGHRWVSSRPVKRPFDLSIRPIIHRNRFSFFYPPKVDVSFYFRVFFFFRHLESWSIKKLCWTIGNYFTRWPFIYC